MQEQKCQMKVKDFSPLYVGSQEVSVQYWTILRRIESSAKRTSGFKPKICNRREIDPLVPGFQLLEVLLELGNMIIIKSDLKVVSALTQDLPPALFHVEHLRQRTERVKL